jgi:hypothetical protein
MVTRIIGKENLNAQAYNVINKVSNIKGKDFGGMHRGLP